MKLSAFELDDETMQTMLEMLSLAAKDHMQSHTVSMLAHRLGWEAKRAGEEMMFSKRPSDDSLTETYVVALHPGDWRHIREMCKTEIRTASGEALASPDQAESPGRLEAAERLQAFASRYMFREEDEGK